MNKRSLSQKIDDFVFHEDTPTHVVQKELESKGVDVSTFLSRVNDTVRKAKQQNIIKAANQERLATERRSKSIDVSTWGIGKLKELLDRATKGDFGSCGQDVVFAHRNHDGDLSEEELRSIAEDLLLLTGESCEENTGDS
jgi:hypothetical protein